MYIHCIKDVVNFKRLRDEGVSWIDHKNKDFLCRYDISNFRFIFGTVEKQFLLIYLQIEFPFMSHRIYGGSVPSKVI